MNNIAQVIGDPPATLRPRVRMSGDAVNVTDSGPGPHRQREADGHEHLPAFDLKRLTVRQRI